jgi:hypothetical protein
MVDYTSASNTVTYAAAPRRSRHFTFLDRRPSSQTMSMPATPPRADEAAAAAAFDRGARAGRKRLLRGGPATSAIQNPARPFDKSRSGPWRDPVRWAEAAAAFAAELAPCA